MAIQHRKHFAGNIKNKFAHKAFTKNWQHFDSSTEHWPGDRLVIALLYFQRDFEQILMFQKCRFGQNYKILCLYWVEKKLSIDDDYYYDDLDSKKSYKSEIKKDKKQIDGILWLDVPCVNEKYFKCRL